MNESAFTRFLEQGVAQGGFEADDVLAAVLPLMRETLAIHEADRVAPLRGLSDIVLHEDRRLGFVSAEGIEASNKALKVYELQAPVGRGVEVIGERRYDSDNEQHRTEVTNLDVAAVGAEITRPMFVPGHVAWEHVIGHHDELTDIHSLGLLLASLTCGLDFTERDELERFADARQNLFSIAPRLHPVIAALITEMTELHRGKRSQDLATLIRQLENYREQPLDTDVLSLPGLETATKGGRRKIIQTHLRDRLFEISRRNRLIYFKSSQGSLNLTTASVPLVLDYRNIQPEQLLYWHEGVAAELSAGRTLPLQKWLRTEETPYLPGQLDKLISEARRSRAEYGFSQLRLVITFLRWNNLREAPQERIHSPLLLLPVELVKRKGVKDHYTLEPQGNEAEVNPALRHHLKQLYDLDLPATVDLRETTLKDFHEKLRALIQKTEPGVSLSLVDKPKIQLIHQRARQSLDQYRRRMARHAKRAKRAGSIDYSYDRSDFRPLGLQMFQRLVQPSPLPLRELAGAPPRPRTPFMVPPTEAGVSERTMFTLVEEAEGNPYAWEFDLCAITLANFNYRKMTLVRDYANLIEHDTANAAFDRIFSIEPKAVEMEAPPLLPPSDQHLIISADATQTGAIAKARRGDSLIIQGPPGTGKSQTITNLIADYAARGKRVLFVCEKRAAIDVVFHRLRQQGLDELCCLIHDSQTDKKEFILNLKQTYEQWLATGNGGSEGDAKRHAALRAMEGEITALERYLTQIETAPAGSASSAKELLHRLIELRGTHDGSACPELSAAEEERLPGYDEWKQHGDAVIRLSEVLHDLGASPVFAKHPLRWLGEAILQRDTPLDGLAERMDDCERRLDDLDDALQQTGLPVEHWDTLEEIGQLLGFAQRLLPIAERGLLDLLDGSGQRFAEFTKLAADFRNKRQELEGARAKTVNWRDKLTAEDTASARALEPNVRGFLKFLNPAWWRLRKVLASRYDFSKHAVAPSWEQVLSDLAAEHAAAAAYAAVEYRCSQEFATQNPDALHGDLARLADPAAAPAVVALRQQLLSSERGAALVKTLAALAPGFQVLEKELRELIYRGEGNSLAMLAAAIREMREEMDALPELLPALRELTGTPEAMRRSVREFSFTAEQLEAACARKSLEQLYREDRMLQHFDCHVLQQKLDRLAVAHRQWLEHNAGWIRAQVRKRFVEHVQISNQSATVLTPEQKVFKKAYSAGRRELEHEFGKTMRYKSIRDLAAGETGEVVRDLKPIWLMSPLSVSDALPLDVALFDVVIFDEASQIPVEDAVPAAYRAPQVIVVGDEMQLPPTSFFSSSGGDGEDEITVEEEGESVSVLMDADSFLTQCARNLPSTLLAWHYRSRYESLISFSNAAFYGGELYTIPDRQLSIHESRDLVAETPLEADELLPAILSRPISYLRCGNAPYEDRRNPTEAAVVARLVRALLLSESKLSIGVAAFSEAQQSEIESALETLAEEDPNFGTLLEAEYVREEDDQFCGLFVKNLENVQGDERDIILMSVCYAPDPNGKMRMNFGPINQRGGEKRLNVIFSRARHHMVLVSSIRHAQITNDYNDGARALRNFLHYAESLSRGEPAAARQVLEGLNPLKRKSLATESCGGLIAGQIASALRGRGWTVDTGVGQSRFRCDVAVRATGADKHQLAVLVEDGGSSGVLERFHTRPGILRAFGWQVATVVAKDWWHDPEAVLERIERLLRKEIPELVEEEIEKLPAEEEVKKPEAVMPQGADAPVEAVAAGEGRRFEFTEGNSRKFWAVAQEGPSLVIRFGRIGTKGQAQTKTFADEARALREMNKLIAEKTGKGYVEVEG
ncbi:WGR domain-containing protein [Luteolibacter sp. GHJ8]|uniref:WGR domain-containing protein n=1 Tax=Luteolibacter rhizosphaerae TaxID=2989719 RepID=A0ABT3FYX8_9BACT|nr:WGR domain-containing protein [Luteolibacter rhizosphaerae]MCW1912801.1 WGR domain-containing protein [Luteolibacter rhizosphaerae]